MREIRSGDAAAEMRRDGYWQCATRVVAGPSGAKHAARDDGSNSNSMATYLSETGEQAKCGVSLCDPNIDIEKRRQ